jgi:hypothetical protein
VRKVRDEWTVMLNPDIVPRVRLNRMYADLFRSHRDSSHADLAAQLQEARAGPYATSSSVSLQSGVSGRPSRKGSVRSSTTVSWR